jgi:aminopeptidase
MSEFSALLARYADVAVRVGANVQPGQDVLVRADLGAAPLAREIVRAAYQAGARFADVFWGDDQVALARFQHAPRDSFDYAPPWKPEILTRQIDAGAALITISSDDPDLLADQPAELVAAAQRAVARHAQPVYERISRSATNWVIVAAATDGWAARVFPDAPAGQRAERLWRAIFSATRLDTADPVAAWRAHVAELDARAAALNARRYDALHYRGPGTDLTVGLVPGHIWCSAGMRSAAGTPFVANLPTEEVYTMPHRGRAEGVVRSSRPKSLDGALVDDFTLTFRDGRVVEAHAARGEAVLRQLIATDEGAARLGEVALVPERSPIARSGLLFYNTLFDENAACHLALGMALRFTLEGGKELDADAFQAIGGNVSSIHQDLMVGSAALDIDGIRADGAAEPLLRSGEWAFDVR